MPQVELTFLRGFNVNLFGGNDKILSRNKCSYIGSLGRQYFLRKAIFFNFNEIMFELYQITKIWDNAGLLS